MLANISSTFFIKGNLVSNDGLRSLPRNSPDCTILESSNFDNCILADGLFEKSSGSFQTCLSVSNNFCEKIVFSVESQISLFSRITNSIS